MTRWVCSTCGQPFDATGYCPADGQPLAATDDPLLGSELGRYRVARLLGEGGMGRVYLAVQPTIGSRVAIKVLSDQCARNPELLERFFAEARAVNLINHERIVSVIDLAQLPDGRPFIVMEYVEGHTLAAIAHAGPVPLGGLVQVVSEVLAALGAAHAIGIVHRDLKPDNVLVTGEGHAKVLDFGIAKLAPELQLHLSPRTRTGALLGTPQYMAPEQISGAGSVDLRSDLYAAGVVLYELATGRLPFAGETLFDLMRGHLELPPPPPRGLRRDLPPALEQVILTALAKRPEDRYASAAAMAQALHDAAATLPPEQWRSLSLRSGSGARASTPSGRGSAPGHLSGVPTAAERPMAFRATHPASASPTVSGGQRARLVLGAAAVAGLAVIATLFVVSRHAGPPAEIRERVEAGSAVLVAAPTGADARAGSAAAASSASTGSASPSTGSASPSTGSASPSTGSADPPARIAANPPRRRPAAAPPAPTPAPSPTGPTIIGGGSAADHGVNIGPGVALNPGVVIGGNAPGNGVNPPAPPGRQSISRPADYNPARFDPVAYLPRARQLARELVPDAELTSFEFDPVFPDGHVDITMEGRDRGYDFRSPSRSAFPEGRPKNLPFERACRVVVELSQRTVTARIVTSDSCDDRLIHPPRCSFAWVWQQALAKGVSRDVVARVGWLFDEKWFFDTDLAGRGGGVSSFAERCP